MSACAPRDHYHSEVCFAAGKKAGRAEAEAEQAAEAEKVAPPPTPTFTPNDCRCQPGDRAHPRGGTSWCAFPPPVRP